MVVLTSFLFELLQYILHIGISDITDIMMNTLGGIIGILFISILEKKIESSKILDNSIKYLLSIIPILMLLLLFLL